MDYKYDSRNIIRKGMHCDFKIPKKNNKVVTAFTTPYDLRTNTDMIGFEEISVVGENFIRLKATYDKAINEYPIGFVSEHSENQIGTEYKILNKIKESYSQEYVDEFFHEFFKEDFLSVHYNEEDLRYNTKSPTRIEVYETDINLNIELNKKIITKDSKACEIKLKNNLSISVSSEWERTIPNEFNLTEDVVKNINVRVINGDENKTGFICIKIYNYIETTTLAPFLKEKKIFLKLNNRTFDIEYVPEKPTVVDPFPDFDNPDSFIEGIVDFPSAPPLINVPNEEEAVYGDKFSKTKAHMEKLYDGTNSIKLGEKVPNDAVNLAYYHNDTASYENALSVIESNTNSITVKRLEMWEHKARVKDKDENVFKNLIEFNGEPNSEYEGYWGILYRDYVAWDKIVEEDQEPQFVKKIITYDGLTSMQAPETFFEDNGTKSGRLELSHTVFVATKFIKDGNKMIPRTWSCKAIYEGYIKLNTYVYNGSAKFSGTITKRDGMSNLDPEQPREILMFPNDMGILEDSFGNSDIDDDLFLVTDVFEGNEPLYYKHRLKKRVYCTNDNKKIPLSLVLENNIPFISSKYKHKTVLKNTEIDNVYDAYIYTNFEITPSNSIYVLYQGIQDSGYNYSNILNSANEKEKLSLYNAIDNDEYEVIREDELTKRSKIKFINFLKVEDLRNKINIKYFIECNGKKSRIYDATVINKDFATQVEKKDFIEERMIISPKNNNGFLTAKDILFNDLNEEEKNEILNSDTPIFKVLLELSDIETVRNENKIIINTNTDGSGIIYAYTFFNTDITVGDTEITYTDLMPNEYVFKSKENYLYKGYSVKCKNINQIKVKSPSEKDLLKGWYPKVKFSYFSKVYERLDKTIRLIYSVPEFNTQIFGEYGRPYIDIKREKVKKIGPHSIRLNNTNIFVKHLGSWIPSNLKIYKETNGSKKELTIDTYYTKEGVIEVYETITDNDDVYCDYSYEERFYKYKGYYDRGDLNSKLIKLNLNPNNYFSYTDTTNEFYYERKTYELFNRTIHFFLKPMRVIDEETGEVEEDNKFCLYHKFDQTANNSFDLHIGRIFMRHYASLKSTHFVDTRNRGGGILEIISDNLRKELEPDSDFYLDITTYDGIPYQENSVLLVRLDRKLLKINGGIFTEDEIEEKVNKWAPLGSLMIIKYVDLLESIEMPSKTLKVERSYKTDFNYRPNFSLTLHTAKAVGFLND